MLNQQGYAALSLVYDTSINPGRWRRALDQVALAIEGKAIALRIRTPETQSKDQNMLNSAYLNFSRSMSGLYYGVRYSHLQDNDWDFLSRQPLHRPTADYEMESDTAKLDARNDYAYLRKKVGISRRLGIRLNNDQVWFDAMSVAFDSRLNTIPDVASLQIGHLLPHLTKSIELGRTFAILKAKYRAALTALDHVQVGLAVALPTGEIIVANKEAKRIFALDDGLVCTSAGKMLFPDADQTAQMESAIAGATHTARGEATTSESLIAAARRSGGSSFLIDVAPLKDSIEELESDFAGALVTIIDPDQPHVLRLDRFALLHGLTAAETEVCSFLVQGLSAGEVAEQRDTSPLTAKNQIASVMQKAGVSRRAELIRLIVRVLPPIE